MQILKEKSRAKSQITFDEDFNVPDAKPDAGRLIQNKGRIILDDVRLTDGKGILTGNLQVDILQVQGFLKWKFCSKTADDPSFFPHIKDIYLLISRKNTFPVSKTDIIHNDPALILDQSSCSPVKKSRRKGNRLWN